MNMLLRLLCRKPAEPAYVDTRAAEVMQPGLEYALLSLVRAEVDEHLRGVLGGRKVRPGSVEAAANSAAERIVESVLAMPVRYPRR